MIKIAKVTGITGGLLMLAIIIIFSSLHFSEPLFNAVLYIGIVGTLLLIVSAIGASEVSKFILIMSLIALVLVITASIMMVIGLRSDQRLVAIPLSVAGNSLAMISTLFEGIAFKTYNRR